jgi:hypothetical protein
MTGHQLLQSYRGRAIVYREDVLLFPPALAVEFVNECQHHAVRLLGYDAFSTQTGGFLQIQDYLDISGREYWDYSVEELCEIVRKRIPTQPDVVFEFVLDD